MTQHMHPDLSVIIPTYKRDKSLAELIRLLKKQVGLVVEIIVVDQNIDNFFSRETLDLLSDVIHMRLPVPNASSARNRGFELAKAPCVLFLDDDLRPDPDFCAKGLKVLSSNNTIDCFVPLVVNHEGEDHALRIINQRTLFLNKENKDLRCIREYITAALFFSAESFLKSGGFDEYLFAFAKTAEDQEFFLRLAYRKIRIWCDTSLHIFHDESLAGGCDLRTVDYWITRNKCIRSWVYRYRIHHVPPGKLSISAYFKLCRSIFLNRKVLFSGLKIIMKQVQLFVAAIGETRNFLLEKKIFYLKSGYTFLNH